jgi:translation initiation factor eIF-2B subunit beta
LKRRQISGSHAVGTATAHLLLRYVSASRWTRISQLINDVRALGRQLVAVQPREFAVGNVVRRVLALIREVGEGNPPLTGPGTTPLISSMFSLLSTDDKEKQPTSKVTQKDAKAEIIEGIQELIDEISNIDDTIAGMSVEMIHDNEILLTPSPGSKTVLEFLLRASQKRTFEVLVTECFPNEISVAHEFAKKLSKAGIRTVIIPDTATSAVMSRVGKVVIGTRSVLANGGCVASAGVGVVCECAKEYRVPVLAVCGLYKLSPLYPFDIESLIEVGDTGKVVSFSDGDLMNQVQVMNPTYDYIAPEHIDIYITNV